MLLSRKNVLLASFVAFVAWGLAVQRLPVLRFIGYAFVAGCLLTIVLILVAVLTLSRPRAALSSDLPQSAKSPIFLAPEKWPIETSRYQSTLTYTTKPLYDTSFVVSQALDGLLNLAMRDFVLSWYVNISRSTSFANQVDKNIRGALAEIRDRVIGEDVMNIIVTCLVPIVTAHLRDCDQAERLVKGRSLSRDITDSDELDLAIAAKYKDGRLHPAASLAYSDTKMVEQEHLRKLVVRILPEVVSEDVIASRAVSVLIKEIVSCAVLFPVLQLLKDPDTWNQIVENYGRTTLQERKTVRRMRAALDEHTTPLSKLATNQDFPRLTSDDNERAFERFVRAIRKTKNLSDARRFRSQVASQLKREALVEGQDPVYLRRLEMAKRVLDQKITKLAMSAGALPGAIQAPESANGATISSQRELSLVDIMHTSSGLSYFMEFMDRQQKMSLVQFWVVVDGLRNPLEDDLGDDPVEQPTQRTWSDADRMDIASISETYVPKTEMKVPEETKKAVRNFLVAGRKATESQYRAARTAILSTQSAVLAELQTQHFPSFKRSDLYFKFLASDEARSSSVTPQPSLDIPRASSPVRPVKPLTQAPPISRTGSHTLAKSRDLRRAALSSTDVRSLGSKRLFDDSDVIGGSDDMENVSPFDDGYDTDPLAHSTHSIGQESLNGDSVERVQVIENMEAAMNNIMSDKQDREPLFDESDAPLASPTSSRRSMHGTDSPRGSLDLLRTDMAPSDKARPNLSTLGLVNTSSRIGVFADNDLFGDEEKFIEDEYVDQEAHDSSKRTADDEIHEAAPGDLGLTEAISALTADVERLIAQEAVVDTLTRKAELVNNVAELRILGKSKASIQREIRRKELQRQQYIVQESDNSLYGKSSIKIKSVMVGRENDGHEFALYVIEVQRLAGDQMPAATWAVARRYSEFHDLHQRLRRRYTSTRNLDFPRRRMVMKLQKQFLHNRRVALENYLQQLLRMPDVCRSRELRSFLSQSAISSSNGNATTSEVQDIVSRIYNSVTDGMDDFLGNMAVLDQLSVAGQNLITAATGQLGVTQNEIVPIESGSVAEAEAELRAFEDKELEPFVKPICDIFLETFELNRGNNWLRGRAVVVVLHQLLGGTVERKIRDVAKGFVQEGSLLRYIDMLKESMWPGGKFREAVVRSSQDKMKTQQEATIVLATLVPDLAANVVGRSNAQAAAKRISTTMNNKRLNQHLAYTLLDEIVGVLFDAPRRKGRLG